MKAEYLSELLKDNKTVILPGIGAFVNNAPSVTAVIFNQYLKFNDGLLVSFISKKENSTAEEAGKKLDVFTSGLISLLESGRDVAIKNLGKLKMDATQKISFTYDSTSTDTVFPAVEKPMAEPVKEIVVEKKQEEKIIPLEKPVVKEEIKIEPVIKPEKEKIEVADWKQQTNKIADASKKEGKKIDPKAKKKNSLVWIILLIVIIGGGGTAGYFYKDRILELVGMSDEKTTDIEEKKNVQVKKNTTENLNVEPAEIDTLIPVEDSIIEIQPEIKEEIVETPPTTGTTSPSSGTYYVIVGCYNEQSNADSMMGKITEKGLQPVNLGSYNGLIHIAAYQSGDSHEAANKAMELRGVFGKAWIFQQK